MTLVSFLLKPRQYLKDRRYSRRHFDRAGNPKDCGGCVRHPPQDFSFDPHWQ